MRCGGAVPHLAKHGLVDMFSLTAFLDDASVVCYYHGLVIWVYPGFQGVVVCLWMARRCRHFVRLSCVASRSNGRGELKQLMFL